MRGGPGCGRRRQSLRLEVVEHGRSGDGAGDLVQLAPLESLHEKKQGGSQGLRTRKGMVLEAKGGREDLWFRRNRGSRAAESATPAS